MFASTHLPVSNQKAKRELGWHPQFPSYPEELRQVVAAYRQVQPGSQFGRSQPGGSVKPG